ncbi:MAG: hypothetical protein FRX49_00156 [Trebouxia sp. A1-2]|nr:MAG: hypothetical protein FRX49_00156 [Trebouxia sp. A1-2]
MPTCATLKAALAGMILLEERSLPAIRVPDSVVSSIWQAAESGNVGSVDEGVDQALQVTEANKQTEAWSHLHSEQQSLAETALQGTAGGWHSLVGEHTSAQTNSPHLAQEAAAAAPHTAVVTSDPQSDRRVQG